MTSEFTPIDSSSDPLKDMIQCLIQTAKENINTVLPCRVESYDANAGTVSVTPLINAPKYQLNGEYRFDPRSVLEDVPVLDLAGSGYRITLPIAVGDNGLLLFSQNSIDSWFNSNGDQQVDPVPRLHDKSDGLFLPISKPPSARPAPADTENLVLEKEGGSNILLKKDGGVDITFDNGTTISVGASKDSNATLTVGDGAASAAIGEQVISYLNSLKTAYDAHTHPTAFGPSGTPPAISAPPASIRSANVKIPSQGES